jgi:hypothetical protein
LEAINIQRRKRMASTKKRVIPLPKNMKAGIPSEEVILSKLKAAGLLIPGKVRGDKAKRNLMLKAFAHLLASRPTGQRHINRLVVDWTRIVETHYGVGCDLPSAPGNKSLFEQVIQTFLPPEIIIPAVEVYEAIYGG